MIEVLITIQCKGRRATAKVRMVENSTASLFEQAIVEHIVKRLPGSVSSLAKDAGFRHLTALRIGQWKQGKGGG